LSENVIKYIISIIEIIQQRILYYKEFNKLKKAHDSNTINEFEKFKNTFANNKNAADREISNFLKSTDNNAKDLIEIDNNKVKIR